MSESPFFTKEGYAVRENTVVQLRQPGTFSEDPLTEILGLGAPRLLARAVEMEVMAFIEGRADLTDEDLRHWWDYTILIHARQGGWWDSNKIGLGPHREALRINCASRSFFS